jgi:hypothetical protein
MVGCEGEVDELGGTAYSNVRRQIFDVSDSGDDDVERKMDFWLKNGGQISHEAVLRV